MRDQVTCPLCHRLFVGEVEGEERYPCPMCWPAPERVRRALWARVEEREREREREESYADQGEEQLSA